MENASGNQEGNANDDPPQSRICLIQRHCFCLSAKSPQGAVLGGQQAKEGLAGDRRLRAERDGAFIQARPVKLHQFSMNFQQFRLSTTESCQLFGQGGEAVLGRTDWPGNATTLDSGAGTELAYNSLSTLVRKGCSTLATFPRSLQNQTITIRANVVDPRAAD